MKLSFKINLLFTGIVSCILIGMAFLIFNLSKENVHRDFRQRIRTRAARASYLYDVFRSDTTNFLKSLDANTPPLLQNKIIYIYDSNFVALYEFHDSDISAIKADGKWLREAKEKGEYFQGIGKREIGIISFTNGLIVMVGAEDIAGMTYITSLQRTFLIYFPLAVLVTLLIGFLFSQTIIRPVKQTIHDVQLITSQNLSHRLYAGKKKDELTQLNETFNALLDRLEESFAMEKRFISNASHELSTPLTSISSQIEVALLHDRSSDDYKKVLGSVLKDTRSLHKLVRSLLEIAKAGTHGAISLEKLRIDEVVIKAHSDVLHLNNEYKIELAFSDLPEDENGCMVFGNMHLLLSAFKNIMENGCKYSPDNKTNVELMFKRDEIIILFSNKGATLHSEEIEKLFEPFYRGTNSENKPGVGLGLTLTRRIISLHKGSLSFWSGNDDRTVVSVILPSLKH